VIRGPVKRKKKRVTRLDYGGVGPGSYDLDPVEHPPHKNALKKVRKGASFARSLRGAGQKPNINPGPSEHNTTGVFGTSAPKFSMGMKTNKENSNSMMDTPGPCDYDSNMIPKLGATHLIGTGKRSDLGIGKSYMSPGPGQYNLRGKLDGPQVGFGTERKKHKVEKTYEPGPGSY